MSIHISSNSVVKECFITQGKKELESKVEGQLYTGELDALGHHGNVGVSGGLLQLFSECFSKYSTFISSAVLL